MDETKLKEIAKQLSCPDGENAVEFGNSMNKINEFITARTIESLEPKQNEVIAEIGPGNGLLSEAMLDILGKNGRYIGIELSEAMAKDAQQRLSNKGCNVEIIQGNCLDVSVPNNTLDGLIAINLLYFIDDLDSFFSHIYNWIKQGGRVVFGVRSKKAITDLPFSQYGFCARTPQEIMSIMEKSGFKEVTHNYHDEGTVTLDYLKLPVDSVIIKGIK